MSRNVVLRVQYNADSVLIFEVHNGMKYEVAQFTTEDLQETQGLPETIDRFAEIAESNPRALLVKLHGSVSAWDAQKEKRAIGPVNGE